VTVAYDAVGNNTTMTDWAGATTFAFDARRSLAGKTDPGSYVQLYAYDGMMNRTKLVNPDGGTYTSVFDNLDRLQSMMNPLNRLSSMQYDPDSRPTTFTTGLGTTRVRSYDPVGQETTLIEYNGANPITTVVDAFAGNGWKTSHNVVTMTGGLLTNYTNDAKGRLIGQAGAGVTGTFSYDAIDNTLLKWHQGQNAYSMTYDAASRILTLTVGAVNTTYVFDNNGNTTLERSGGVTTGYSYDFENRLKGVQHSDGTLSSYSYSGGTGLRRFRQEPTDSFPHTIIWDGKDYLLEY
jgi:YD repeat-containing protein